MESLEGVIAEKHYRLMRLGEVEKAVEIYGLSFSDDLSRCEQLRYCRIGVFHYYSDIFLKYYGVTND